MMLSLLIIEDHELMSEVLVRLIQTKTDMKVAATAQSAEEALRILPNLTVDLVLVDISLPKMSGIDLVSTLQKAYPDLPCLMLSGHNASHYVRRSLRAGARGYLLKDDPHAIIEGIKEVMDGNIYVSKQFDNI